MKPTVSLGRGCVSVRRGALDKYWQVERRELRQRLCYCLLFASLLSVLVCWVPAFGADELPLFEQEPFDQVTLTQEHNSVALKIFPLGAEGRRQIANHQPTMRLRVRLVDHPEMEFDVEWKDIARVDLFPEVLLRQTRQLIKDRRLDEAFQYLQFLNREYPGRSEFDAVLEQFLFTDAGTSFSNGQLREALAVLDELYNQNSNRSGLTGALRSVARKLFEQYVNRGDFRAARKMLDWAPQRFGQDSFGPTVTAWRRQLQGMARQHYSDAQKFASQRNWRMAHDAARRALAVWPELPGVTELAAELDKRHPRVTVGVTRGTSPTTAQRVDDWAAWRDGRLLRRSLIERRGFGADGVRYYCPWGTLSIADDRRHVTIQLSPPRDNAVEPLHGFDVSRVLLARARPDTPQFDAPWAQHLHSVSVDGVYGVEVQLTGAVLRPEALLTVPLQHDAGEDDTDGVVAPSTSPYVVGQRERNDTRLFRNDAYLLRTTTQPAEIEERYFADPAEMVLALENGDIDVCDRVYPADVPRLRRRQQIIVAPYAVPSIHVLVPNLKRPFTGQRSFRRAVGYGLNRPLILQELLGGAQLDGCQVISGPFPAGSHSDDPLAYAYDFQVAPRNYDPRMAVTLSEVCKLELATLANKAQREPPQLEKLILVHPADAVPRMASSMIAEQLTAIGIQCQTKELEPTQPMPADDAWDLMYVDVVMSEPLYDIRRLLGRYGLAKGGSAYLEYALGQLGSVANWSEARQRLGAIHRLAHEELVVIPLWQLVDFYAYRDNVTGMGTRLLSLYDNVERWQVGLEPQLADR